jgi:hypothetical protein
MRKVCVLLVFLTYMYHDARFRECKEEQVAYLKGLCLVKIFCDQLCTEDGSTCWIYIFSLLILLKIYNFLVSIHLTE